MLQRHEAVRELFMVTTVSCSWIGARVAHPKHFLNIINLICSVFILMLENGQLPVSAMRVGCLLRHLTVSLSSI